MLSSMLNEAYNKAILTDSLFLLIGKYKAIAINIFYISLDCCSMVINNWTHYVKFLVEGGA